MPIRILIVDDEPDVAEFQKAFLQRRHFTVFTALKTEPAMSLIETERPDIVFCDVRVDTDTSGLDILQRAKQIKPDIVVYLITGLLDADLEKRGIELGAREVLSKPISINEILKKIEEAGVPEGGQR